MKSESMLWTLVYLITCMMFINDITMFNCFKISISCQNIKPMKVFALSVNNLLTTL